MWLTQLKIIESSKLRALAHIFCSRNISPKTYEELHPSGPKSDYGWHTEAMDRAMDGGIDDVGIGVI